MSTRPVLPPAGAAEPDGSDVARVRERLADYRHDLNDARCFAVGYLTAAIEAIAEGLAAGDLAAVAGAARRCRAFDAALAELTGGKTARQSLAEIERRG